MSTKKELLHFDFFLGGCPTSLFYVFFSVIYARLKEHKIMCYSRKKSREGVIDTQVYFPGDMTVLFCTLI